MTRDIPDEPSVSYPPRKRPGRPIPDGPGSVPVTTTMPLPLRDWLRQHAAEREVPMAQVITKALLEYRLRAGEVEVA